MKRVEWLNHRVPVGGETVRPGLLDIAAVLAFVIGALLDAVDTTLVFSTAGWACVGLALLVVGLALGPEAP